MQAPGSSEVCMCMYVLYLGNLVPTTPTYYLDLPSTYLPNMNDMQQTKVTGFPI